MAMPAINDKLPLTMYRFKSNHWRRIWIVLVSSMIFRGSLNLAFAYLGHEGVNIRPQVLPFVHRHVRHFHHSHVEIWRRRKKNRKLSVSSPRVKQNKKGEITHVPAKKWEATFACKACDCTIQMRPNKCSWSSIYKAKLYLQAKKICKNNNHTSLEPSCRKKSENRIRCSFYNTSTNKRLNT